MNAPQRNPAAEYGSSDNLPAVGDTCFYLGESFLVKGVRGDWRTGREVMRIRRGFREWIPAGMVILVKAVNGLGEASA